MGEKCGFGWGWGGVGWQGTSGSRFEQAAGRKTADNRGQVKRGGVAERLYVQVCCLLRQRMSPCSLSFHLSIFFWFSLYISFLSLCSLSFLYRQCIFFHFYQCHKSNLAPLQWITVFQQTQQSNAPVLPPQHSNSPSIIDLDIAYSQRHSDTSSLGSPVIILQT